MPVVIIQGLDTIEEMRQFRDINGNQKRVSTSLVNMILTQLESAQGEHAIAEKDRWKVVATHVINHLCASEADVVYSALVQFWQAVKPTNTNDTG